MLEKVQRETGITLERTLREIARIGFFDPRRMFAPDGRPLGITELDDDIAAVIAGLDVARDSPQGRRAEHPPVPAPVRPRQHCPRRRRRPQLQAFRRS